MDQNQFRKIIGNLGLSTQVVAALLNVTPRAVSLWLNGDRSVPGTVDAYMNLFMRLNSDAQRAEIAGATMENRPMREGMYYLEFVGPLGTGAGTITLESGRLYGFDVGGGAYDGVYTFDPSTNLVSVEMEVRMPAGAFSVLGPPQKFDWTLKVKTAFDRDHTGKITAHTDIGSVEGNIRFMRALPVAA
jgi:small nuclear ribonucleoprotein (snRNP)-like protein